jgi:hypothetical protein
MKIFKLRKKISFTDDLHCCNSSSLLESFAVRVTRRCTGVLSIAAAAACQYMFNRVTFIQDTTQQSAHK